MATFLNLKHPVGPDFLKYLHFPFIYSILKDTCYLELKMVSTMESSTLDSPLIGKHPENENIVGLYN